MCKVKVKLLYIKNPWYHCLLFIHTYYILHIHIFTYLHIYTYSYTLLKLTLPLFYELSQIQSVMLYSIPFPIHLL